VATSFIPPTFERIIEPDVYLKTVFFGCYLERTANTRNVFLQNIYEAASPLVLANISAKPDT